MTHYVCTGSCGGESKVPGVCEAEFCTKEGQSLVSCSCEDGMHEDASQDGPEKSEEPID
jgi:hypothetical protein